MKKISILFFIIFGLPSLLFAAGNNDFYQKALQYIQQDNYTEAFNNLSKALAAEPNNMSYKKQMAFVQYKRKKVVEAIPLLQEMIAAGIDVNINNARLTDIYNWNNKYQLAIEVSKNVTAKDLTVPEQIDFYSAVGNAYQKTNYFPQAIENFNKVVKLDNTKKDILYKLAETHSDLTRYDLALPIYKQALQMDGTNFKRLFEAGICAENTGKKDEAIAFFLQAKENGYPNNIDFNYEVANTYYDKKDYKNAIIYLDIARAISPYDQDIASLTAYSYYNAGDTKTARTVIQGMMEINPTNGDLVYLMGLTYQKEGNMNKAENYFDKAFKLKPQLESLRTSKVQF
jgi:tetratricopeptide (TPR) repeat protein